MTIYEIKRRSQAKKPYYFSKDTMNFFNQTLKDFKVCKIDGFKNIYMFWAKSWGNNVTQAYFDAITNDINNNLETLIKQRENNGTK